MAKLSPEGIGKLKQLVQDGVSVYQECEDLQEGLSDTIKAVGEELEVKPSLIKKLIKDIQKNKVDQRRSDNEILEELHKIVGH